MMTLLPPGIPVLKLVTIWGLLVIVPLGLRFTSAKNTLMFVLAALLAVASLYLPTSDAAGWLAVPWLLFSGALFAGSLRTAQRDWVPLAALERLWLLISASWLWIDRSQATVFGFSPVIAQLTVIHFLFAGFGTTQILQRALLAAKYAAAASLPRLRVVTIVFEFCFVLVAVGISTGKVVEAIAGSLLSLAGMTLAALLLQLALKSFSGIARMSSAASALSLFCSMALSLHFSLSHVLPSLNGSIPWMLATHGTLNAFGFVFLGLLGWPKPAFEATELNS